jgi:NAD(P)-dependent dehydrogenase (short-subunit alcohol dehydrogenase family)
MVGAGILVVGQEHPALTCGIIDVEPARIEGPFAEALAARLSMELDREEPEPLVAFRGNARVVPEYEPASKSLSVSRPRPLIRDQGVYLITGGLGQVGSVIAEYLARRFWAKLVLTGRSALPESGSWDHWMATHDESDPVSRKMTAVRRLKQLGAEVLLVRADVGDVESMRDVLERVRDQFGDLHGVIHAAGVLDANALSILAGVSREECERQFRPKVRGVYVLDEVLDTVPVDFVLLMSSLSTLVGGVGLGIYAAANAFMDGFVFEQHRRGKSHWVSVNWDSWRAEEGEVQTSALGAELMQLSMTPTEGTGALEHILSLGPIPRVIVSTGDLAARIERWTRFDAVGRAKEPTTESAGPRHQRPNLQNVYVAPEDPLQEQLSRIWGALLGIESVGIHDNFFELGGTSLLAIQMIAKLETDLGVKVSTASLFEGPTIHALSQLITSPPAKGDLS